MSCKDDGLAELLKDYEPERWEFLMHQYNPQAMFTVVDNLTLSARKHREIANNCEYVAMQLQPIASEKRERHSKQLMKLLEANPKVLEHYKKSTERAEAIENFILAGEEGLIDAEHVEVWKNRLAQYAIENDLAYVATEQVSRATQIDIHPTDQLSSDLSKTSNRITNPNKLTIPEPYIAEVQARHRSEKSTVQLEENSATRTETTNSMETPNRKDNVDSYIPKTDNVSRQNSPPNYVSLEKSDKHGNNRKIRPRRRRRVATASKSSDMDDSNENTSEEPSKIGGTSNGKTIKRSATPNAINEPNSSKSESKGVARLRRIQKGRHTRF